MIFEVTHSTIYSYSEPVTQSQHLIHLVPRPHPRQRVIEHQLNFDPAPAMKTDFTDYFGNPASILAIQKKHTRLSVTSSGRIEVSPAERIDLARTMPWERLAQSLTTRAGLDLDMMQYVCDSPYADLTAQIRAYALQSFLPERPVLEAAGDLTQRIHRDFIYDSNATDVATRVEEVLSLRRGVCQDFAHLGIACVRSLGLPARYVSGYLLTRPPEGRERLIGADASHAWMSVWAPETGWVDFDPTNDVIPSGEHITIAHGRDFGDVSPISGVILGGSEHQIRVAVDVVPIATTDLG